MSNYDHLDEKTQGLMVLPGAQRGHHMLVERFFTHDRLTPILEHIEFLRYSPPQTRAAGLVVSGDPGSGKSMLASAVKRRYGPQPSDGVNAASMPVLTISMTNAREAKTMYSRILEALGVPDAVRYVGSDRERRALQVCRAAGVRLLVVDEIQDVLTSTARQQRIALDTIKFLMNELSLPIVALGTARAPQAMQVDEHLNARMSVRTLPVWTNDVFLTNFLDAFERVLPLAKHSHLSSPAIASVLLRVSKGQLSDLVKCLCYAAAHAANEGTERVLPAALETALQRPPVEALRAKRAAEDATAAATLLAAA